MQLDHPVEPFDLKTPAGELVGLGSLVESGPLVLAAVEGDANPDPRLDMLRELGRSASEHGARLAIVSHGDCGLGRQLDAAGVATWLTDPDAVFQQLGLAERKLGRVRRRSGVFVVDPELILRFSFTSKDAEEWIPASFVISRLRRLAAATPAPATAPDPAPQAVAEPAVAEPAPAPAPVAEPKPAVEEPVTVAAPEPPSQSAVDAEMESLVRQVGERLGMGPDELSRLATASRFRDLGMAVVPDAIITKDGPLTDEEWDVIKQHPNRSAEMLGQGAPLEPVRAIVRASHEHLDGSGYPLGLVGDQIPVGARILLACESYLAMTQERPYREMLGMRDAVDELRQYAGRIYDARVVDALVTVVAESGRQSVAA